MLKKRVITALVLLSLLMALLWANSSIVFIVAAAVFLAAAIWESSRLFRSKYPAIGAIAWTAVFLFLALRGYAANAMALLGLCVAIWVFRLAPALAIGLPPFSTMGNRLVSAVYNIAIVGCFIAILALFAHSALYLVSVMALVWIADVGAYFFGKAFGRHKLAASISPGKSWEGAVGGWFAVMAIASVTTIIPRLHETFAVKLQAKLGWFGGLAVITFLVVSSVIGDLLESQLKRRAGVKDSSHLLPGHGGILDRIDALIPVLPMAVFLDVLLGL